MARVYTESEQAAIFHNSYSPEPNSGCWFWTKAVSNRGYGVMPFGTSSNTAHRFSYRLAHGSIPGGLCVLHRCNQRTCVNPDHLYAGTDADNARDRVTAGTSMTPYHKSLLERTHCSRGHLMDGRAERQDRRNGIKRYCRTCRDAAHARLYAMKPKLKSDPNWKNHQARKTHCLHGHPFSGENLTLLKSGQRSCKACGRARYHNTKPKFVCEPEPGE